MSDSDIRDEDILELSRPLLVEIFNRSQGDEWVEIPIADAFSSIATTVGYYQIRNV